MRWNEDYLNEKTAKDFVLVPVGDSYVNGIFVLNETAQKIVELLRTGKDREKIVATLCAEYDGSNTVEITDCVDETLKKLREIGAIIDD